MRQPQTLHQFAGFEGLTWRQRLQQACYLIAYLFAHLIACNTFKQCLAQGNQHEFDKRRRLRSPVRKRQRFVISILLLANHTLDGQIRKNRSPLAEYQGLP